MYVVCTSSVTVRSRYVGVYRHCVERLYTPMHAPMASREAVIDGVVLV